MDSPVVVHKASYLAQGWRDAAPYIDLGKGEAAGMKVTLDEAERVAAMLLALVAVGRRERTP